MRRGQGAYNNASAKKSVDRNLSNPPKGHASNFQELDDYSEMNQSIKMSFNQPKYAADGKVQSMVLSQSPNRSDNVPKFGEMLEQVQVPEVNMGSKNEMQIQNEYETDTLSAAQIRFLELKRFVFQLDNILDFSRDDAADLTTLIKMIEQCIGLKINLNPQTVTPAILNNCIEDVIKNLDTAQ